MDKHTRINIAIGAVVSFALLELPGGPLLGGGLAGYLTETGTRDGLRTGVLAGALALGIFLVVSVVTTPVSEAADHGIAHFLWVGINHVILRSVPLLVWPLLGGWIGAYVRLETT